MKLISENLHVISKSIKEALINRNEKFIRELLIKQIATSPDWIDLNIGPGRKQFEGIMNWLTVIVKDLTDIPISFDSSNINEITSGLNLMKNPQDCLINSATAESERLEKFTDCAAEYKCNLIALTLDTNGIPKTADGRIELAMNIYETTSSKGIDNQKLYFDPLILPVCVDQSQAIQALDSIRMFKESFDPQVMTTIGLSNVSNSCPNDLRKLINQVFFILAAGCGLDSAIADSFDSELLRINKVLETSTPQESKDQLIIDLYNMMKDFGELEDIKYETSNIEQVKLYKTAEILLNKKIYSNSYLEI